MDVLHPRCAGVDVGKELIVACRRIVTETGVRTELLSSGGSVRELMRLRAWLEEAGVTHVVMEATGVYWKPVWHALEDGLDLILANPLHVRRVPGRKSDVSDAQWLAELLAHGLVAASFVPERPTQEARDLTRTHCQLTREAAPHAQRLQKVLEDADLKVAGVLSDILGVSGRRILKAIIDGETSPAALADQVVGVAKRKKAELREALEGHVRDHHRFLLEVHLKQVEALEATLALVEQRLEAHFLSLTKQVVLLSTVPGINSPSARSILAEIGPDMSRFPTVGHLISWAGLCPKLHESAGKRKPTKTKKGDPWLKTLLVQCAWAAVRVKNSYLRARFFRLKARRGAKKAAMAIAAELLRAAYFILTRQVPYRELGGEYYDRLDTHKTRSSLVRRLRNLGYEVQLTPVA